MKSSAERDCFSLIQQIAMKQDPFCIIGGEPSTVGHHLFGRGLAAAFHPEMIRGLCNNHHQAAHTDPLWFEREMIRLMGRRYEELEKMAREVVPWMDFKAKRDELRQILEGLR